VSEQSYSVPAKTWQTELTIKRSKFLSFVANATNKQQANGFIRSLHKQHPQANHICWAYIAGSPQSTVRSMSDDGEPNGTAGMPMLKVLEHSGYGHIVVAVVRYFGGIKLGTGGLHRAYSDAVSLVLLDLPLQQYVSRTILEMVYGYSYEGQISRLFNRYDVVDIQPQYAQAISISVAVASHEVDALKAELINITSGGINIRNAALQSNYQLNL
jgi:uncharacterized YigZ family protein